MPVNQEAQIGFSSVVIKCEQPEMTDSDNSNIGIDSEPEKFSTAKTKSSPLEIESRTKEELVSNRGGPSDAAIKHKTEMSCSDNAFFFEEVKMNNEQSGFNVANAKCDPLATETYIKQENEVYVSPSFSTFSGSDNSDGDRPVSVNESQPELEVKRKTPFHCDICNKNFSQRGKLKDHKLTHTGEKPYQCDVCSKNFTRLSNLSDHKRIHTGEKPYKCDVCDKTYNRSSGLFRHKNTHGRVDRSVSVKVSQQERKIKVKTPFQCDVCGKTFIQLGKLRDHRLTHTGEKPYQCDICSKNFTRLSNLSDHKRVHTGEKPYKCDVCNKTYNRSSGLIRHKNTHTGEKQYRCDICDKCFFQRESLKVHERCHSGERPFQCDLCDKTFIHSSHLRRHKLRHKRVQLDGFG